MRYVCYLFMHVLTDPLQHIAIQSLPWPNNNFLLSVFLVETSSQTA